MPLIYHTTLPFGFVYGQGNFIADHLLGETQCLSPYPAAAPTRFESTPKLYPTAKYSNYGPITPRILVYITLRPSCFKSQSTCSPGCCVILDGPTHILALVIITDSTPLFLLSIIFDLRSVLLGSWRQVRGPYTD